MTSVLIAAVPAPVPPVTLPDTEIRVAPGAVRMARIPSPTIPEIAAVAEMLMVPLPECEAMIPVRPVTVATATLTPVAAAPP